MVDEIKDCLQKVDLDARQDDWRGVGGGEDGGEAGGGGAEDHLVTGHLVPILRGKSDIRKLA